MSTSTSTLFGTGEGKSETPEQQLTMNNEIPPRVERPDEAVQNRKRALAVFDPFVLPLY